MRDRTHSARPSKERTLYNVHIIYMYIVVVIVIVLCVVCSKWNIWHLAQCKSLDNNEEAIIYSCYVPPSLGFLLFVYARLRMRIRERMVCHKIEPFHHVTQIVWIYSTTYKQKWKENWVFFASFFLLIIVVVL